MLLDGVIIMIIGMGVVFSFLIIMVLAMSVTARLMPVIAKYFPEEMPQQDKITKIVEQYDEVAVVLAAVKAFR